MNRPTLARFTGLAAFEGALDDLPAALAEGLVAALAALLGARGVTAEGAFGKPLAVDFFAGPGRFNLVLERLEERWHHTVDVATTHGHDEVSASS